MGGGKVASGQWAGVRSLVDSGRGVRSLVDSGRGEVASGQWAELASYSNLPSQLFVSRWMMVII